MVMRMSSSPKDPAWKRYAYGWVTLGFFLISLVGHWVFGWFAYVNEQAAHQAAVSVSDYTVEMMRDTLENWQSEFLQLLWQVGGLAILLYVGSPSSRESSERVEEKLDAILRMIDKDKADALIAKLDHDYDRSA
jgi:hypothetical protein